MIVGRSRVTPDKQNGLDKILSQHISVCQTIFRKGLGSVYHYIDTNAGCGYVPDYPMLDGSPIVFLKAATQHRVSYRAYFVDKDEENINQLRQQALGWSDCHALHGDHNEWVPRLVKHLPRNAYGLVYMDCNGAPNFELLAEISKIPTANRLDFLIRCNCTAVKWKKGYPDKHLTDYLDAINKKHWLIRRLKSGDAWHWTFFLGMNWRGMNAWKSQGFHWIDTEEGRDILNIVNYTAEERDTMGITGNPRLL